MWLWGGNAFHKGRPGPPRKGVAGGEAGDGVNSKGQTSHKQGLCCPTTQKVWNTRGGVKEAFREDGVLGGLTGHARTGHFESI